MIYIFDKFNEVKESEYLRLYNLLPKSRKHKADMRAGIDKQICILEYFILKDLLKFDGYPDFEYTAEGKPYLKNFHFSISHADNVLCLAIENVDCGIDIEKVADFNPKIANYILNENEKTKVENSKQKNVTLTKFFTQKEATTKCIGIKLNCDLKNITDKKTFKYTFKKYKNYIICECIKKI